MDDCRRLPNGNSFRVCRFRVRGADRALSSTETICDLSLANGSSGRRAEADSRWRGTQAYFATAAEGRIAELSIHVQIKRSLSEQVST
jgi:hypothetical protein